MGVSGCFQHVWHGVEFQLILFFLFHLSPHLERFSCVAASTGKYLAHCPMTDPEGLQKVDQFMPLIAQFCFVWVTHLPPRLGALSHAERAIQERYWLPVVGVEESLSLFLSTMLVCHLLASISLNRSNLRKHPRLKDTIILNCAASSSSSAKYSSHRSDFTATSLSTYSNHCSFCINQLIYSDHVALKLRKAGRFVE